MGQIQQPSLSSKAVPTKKQIFLHQMKLDLRQPRTAPCSREEPPRQRVGKSFQSKGLGCQQTLCGQLFQKRGLWPPNRGRSAQHANRKRSRIIGHRPGIQTSAWPSRCRFVELEKRRSPNGLLRLRCAAHLQAAGDRFRDCSLSAAAQAESYPAVRSGFETGFAYGS